MRNIYRIFSDADRNDLMTVVDYEMGDFDLTVFWSGQEFHGNIPEEVRLYVDPNDAPKPDWVGNPISWPICSERFIALCGEYLTNDVKFFDAPFFDKFTGSMVSGYKIINTIRNVPCIDLENSVVSYSDEDGSIFAIYEFALRQNQIPSNVHIFRPSEYEHAIMVSEELVDKMRGQGLHGLVLQKTKSN